MRAAKSKLKRRVYVTAKNADRLPGSKSSSLTVYDATAVEVIDLLRKSIERRLR